MMFGSVSVSVFVPTVKWLDWSRLIVVPSSVIAGPPGETVEDPTTKPVGFAISVIDPTVTILAEVAGTWTWPSEICWTGVTEFCRGFNL